MTESGCGNVRWGGFRRQPWIGGVGWGGGGWGSVGEVGARRERAIASSGGYMVQLCTYLDFRLRGIRDTQVGVRVDEFLDWNVFHYPSFRFTSCLIRDLLTTAQWNRVDRILLILRLTTRNRRTTRHSQDLELPVEWVARSPPGHECWDCTIRTWTALSKIRQVHTCMRTIINTWSISKTCGK